MRTYLSTYITVILLGLLLPFLMTSCLGVVLFEAPQQATAGQSMPVKLRIKSDTESLNVKVAFYLSNDRLFDNNDLYLDYYNLGALSVQSYRDFSTQLTLPADLLTNEYFLLAIVYDEGWMIYNGGENVYSRLIKVSGVQSHLPDLVVTNPYVIGSPGNNSYYGQRQLLPGDKFAVSLSLENRGHSAAGGSQLRLYLSQDQQFSEQEDLLLSSHSVSLLAAGAQTEITLTTTLPPLSKAGPYQLLIIPDYLNQVNEYDEQNQINRLIWVPHHRLEVQSLSVPGLAVAGTNFTVQAKVANHRFLSPASTGRLYLSKDGDLNNDNAILLAEIPLPPIGRGSNVSHQFSEQISLPDNIQTGAYYLTFQAGNTATERIFIIGSESNFQEVDLCTEVEMALEELPNTTVATAELPTPLPKVDHRLPIEDNFGVKLYPNPARNNVQLELDIPNAAGAAELMVFDAAGRQMAEFFVPSISAGVHQQQLDISRLPRGQYLIRIRIDDKEQTRRLVVQ